MPYKTCRLLILLEPFSENALKSIKKALGFHYKLIAFYDFVKRQKQLATQRFAASKKVMQNTL